MPAWAELDTYIQNAVESCTHELKAKPFTDVAEVSHIQGKIKGLEAIYGFINDAVRRGMQAP